MTSRASMIESIRSSLAKSVPFEGLYHHLQPSPRGEKLPSGIFSREELADRFSAELSSVGGEVHRAANEVQAVRKIKEILAEVGANRIAISDLDLLRDSSIVGLNVIADPSREDLFSVNAGISTAQLAIAETGTLVLRSSSERHRLVSLVPPAHVCVLKADNIRPSMDSVLEEMSDNIDPTITFITGPSRTSDIELTLAIGVHGPKRLIVVLIDQI